MAQIINNIGIGNQVVQNDFDNMPIYKDIRQVTDSQGNVFMRIPKFYIRKDVTPNKYQPIISEEQLPGFYLPKCFWDFTNNKELPYVDIGKYLASLSADGTKLESKTGKEVLVEKTIGEFRDLAKVNGTGYQLIDIHVIDVLQTLFRVEFATMDSQSIHPGLTDGSRSLTGGTDGVVASSGAMGTTGVFQFKYRGIEDLWGNAFQWVDGVNISNRQAWVCHDASKYVSNVFAEPYQKINYVNASVSGYVSEMGYDPNNSFVEFPISVNGTFNTYYGDSYIQDSGVTVAHFGGDNSGSIPCGLALWRLHAGTNSVYNYTGSRLIRKAV